MTEQKKAMVEACKTLQINKGMMMRMAYGKNYQGIDSALPQGYVDNEGLSYGHENPDKDLSFLVYNYNKHRSLNPIDNMLDVLSEEKKAALVLCAFTYKRLLERVGSSFDGQVDYVFYKYLQDFLDIQY